jgi:hypothetical protein
MYRRPVLDNLTAHNAQQGIPADRQHQPPGQRSSRSTAQGNAEMADDQFKPRCPPRSSAGNRFTEPLCENATLAAGFGAAETANRDAHLNGATV